LKNSADSLEERGAMRNVSPAPSASSEVRIRMLTWIKLRFWVELSKRMLDKLIWAYIEPAVDVSLSPSMLSIVPVGGHCCVGILVRGLSSG
jgi:hypothetical protein